jgi:hypothetical protein
MRNATIRGTDAPTTEPQGTNAETVPTLMRLDWVIGGVVLVVYLITQLLLLLGPRPLDPARYFDTAVDFPNVPVDLWTLRIGLIAPVRVAVLFFGPSVAALYAVPIAVGLVLAAAVYGTMLLLFRDRVLAAAAALVTVLNTNYLFTSSYIYPDTTATATFTAGFFFLVLAGVRSQHGDRGWVPTLAVISAGVVFGWSYLIREFSPFLLPAVIVALVVLRYSARRIALLAGAALATAGLELAYGAVRYGDPFIHARQLLYRRHSAFGEGRAARMEHIQSQLGDVLDTMLVFPRLVLSWRSGWLFLLLIVVFLVALMLVRDRRLWMIAAWVLSFWTIMIAIGLAELPSGRWILNITNVRYWYPLLPALVMGAFSGLWLLLERWLPPPRGVRLAQAVTAAFAVVTLAPGLAEFKGCADRQAWWSDPAERWGELRSWFSTTEAEQYDIVWTDQKTQRLVPAYIATTFGKRIWDGDVETFHGRHGRISPATDLAHSLVLVHKDRFRSAVRQPETRLIDLRGEWWPVFASSDGNMVLLAHESAGTSSAAMRVDRDWWLLPDPAPRADPGVCGRSPYEKDDSAL